ncbi:cellulose synthase complex periplasmic endoglucanase BcsZ [Photobacterium toruni]|uniref:cellulose synthase complex periplasmic endoglucanase BcsZ n=1 Tax=Photobacterium toruni TaxID=1935446 RepID=UPI00210FE683|nr:cellulose synthase complex periplasmic endoglucanase BcsZ [Photobacterium toruni]
MKKWFLVLSLCLSFSVSAKTCDWPAWLNFKSIYIKQGRVIDGSDPRLITTSEGQSYGLFFALVANDKEAFSQILNWTQIHLAGGDLTATLPAWLWGKNSDGQFGVIDANSASDSDLWITYALAEAGRLWHDDYYQSLAYFMSMRILHEESVNIQKQGLILLPAPKGFYLGNNTYRVNPSYSPLQLIMRMNTLYPGEPWQVMYKAAVKMLVQTMPTGFSPDWVELKQGIYIPDRETEAVGSYNAIRTYLWAGMLDDSIKEKATVIQIMQPMVKAIEILKAPPRKVNTQTGTYVQVGSAGFSAAILPLLSASKQTSLLAQQVKRAQSVLEYTQNDHYYDSVLVLFGLGWKHQRYQFGVDGQLLPAWSDQ